MRYAMQYIQDCPLLIKKNWEDTESMDKTDDSYELMLEECKKFAKGKNDEK